MMILIIKNNALTKKLNYSIYILHVTVTDGKKRGRFLQKPPPDTGKCDFIF